MSDNSIPGAKLLIVDDEPSVRAMLAAVLESENYEVTTAASAADATQKIGASEFDLVITDMRMESAIAGFDVVRAAKLRSPQMAVVIITAFPISNQHWRREGADAALSKPTPIVELLETVSDLLRARRQFTESKDAATH